MLMGRKPPAGKEGWTRGPAAAGGRKRCLLRIGQTWNTEPPRCALDAGDRPTARRSGHGQFGKEDGDTWRGNRPRRPGRPSCPRSREGRPGPRPRPHHAASANRTPGPCVPNTCRLGKVSEQPALVFGDAPGTSRGRCAPTVLTADSPWPTAPRGRRADATPVQMSTPEPRQAHGAAGPRPGLEGPADHHTRQPRPRPRHWVLVWHRTGPPCGPEG